MGVKMRLLWTAGQFVSIFSSHAVWFCSLTKVARQRTKKRKKRKAKKKTNTSSNSNLEGRYQGSYYNKANIKLIKFQVSN
jgi:hypothetical protein